MRRDELTDLGAFMAVAEECSFTRAAARLGTSQSALSHTVRRLETRLGVRLLSRTTRNVMPTEAGERLLATLRPAFDEIGSQLASLSALRDKPAGSVRITTGKAAVDTILWPRLEPLLRNYPDIQLEISVDLALRDIVAERFDAGVRLGESIARDMIAVPIGPEMRMAVVGSPDYFARCGRPRTPQDLAQHRCINLRLPTLGGLYAWEFEKGGREVKVRVDGQLVFNEVDLMLRACADGFGLVCMIEDHVSPWVADGRLERVMEDWCEPFAGYHLYYPSRRQLSPAFALVVDALRYRG